MTQFFIKLSGPTSRSKLLTSLAPSIFVHRFEKDLKTKLSQKCPATQEEAAFLTKTFKFFDIQNQGSVTKDQFGRAITKVGVVLADGMVSILSLHHQPLTRRCV